MSLVLSPQKICRRKMTNLSNKLNFVRMFDLVFKTVKSYCKFTNSGFEGNSFSVTLMLCKFKNLIREES